MQSGYEYFNLVKIKGIERGNWTSIHEFILMGFSGQKWLQIVLFAFFLLFYLLNIFGNLIIMTMVISDHALNSPMYFLLANLSFLDIVYSSVTLPKTLVGFLKENRITVNGCILQMHFFHFLGCTEGVLLAVMGYDRYAAICQPLRYNLIMNKSICIQLVSTSWVTGLIYSMSQTVMTAQLTFCKFNKIRHFFCDVKPIIKLSCSNTYLNELMLIIIGGFFSTGTLFLTVISYCFISTHLLKINSKGRQKAISTCSSHLSIVIMFYGTAVCTYLGPASVDSIEKDRVAAILFTVITPALNPIIYTLRNKEVRQSFKKLFKYTLYGRMRLL
ncbi:olfactory receptor 12D3-like [Bombina bombina]|uniref:olfactory receptor 12D3-like n=1 Tax=Bombina bombina TaxID=8345 RepID=UPI00235A9B3C|nr:olfactory receptor 12D3-like [Bombina bombina]